MDLNVSAIIFSALRKAKYLEGRRYGFGGQLTRFLKKQGVPEKEVYYRPPVCHSPLDFSRTKVPTLRGVNLTMPEHQAQNNEIIARIYALTMFQLKIGGASIYLIGDSCCQVEQPTGTLCWNYAANLPKF